MAMDEGQVEQLEAYLDGALPPEVAEALRRRMEREPGLAAELEQMRVERSRRVVAFAGMEGDEGIADRLLAGARARVNEPVKTRRRWMSPLRYAVAAAACLGVGFAVGRIMDGTRPGPWSAAGANESAYRVAITDDRSEERRVGRG